MASINLPGFSYEMLRNSAAKTFGFGFLMICFSLVLAMIVEAGLFNMYKSCIQHGSVVTGSFGQGIKKYAFKFLLINILTILGWGSLLYLYSSRIRYSFCGICTGTLYYRSIHHMWKVYHGYG